MTPKNTILFTKKSITMTNDEKKAEIKRLALELLVNAFNEAPKDLDRVMKSGAIDVDSWTKGMEGQYLLPKTIATAILQKAARQYAGKGTKYEKKVQKEASNIQMFL